MSKFVCEKLTISEVEGILAEVKSTMEMEEFVLTETEIEVLRKFLSGKISEEQVFELFEIPSANPREAELLKKYFADRS